MVQMRFCACSSCMDHSQHISCGVCIVLDKNTSTQPPCSATGTARCQLFGKAVADAKRHADCTQHTKMKSEGCTGHTASCFTMSTFTPPSQRFTKR
jgi:hypothetical protein